MYHFKRIPSVGLKFVLVTRKAHKTWQRYLMYFTIFVVKAPKISDKKGKRDKQKTIIKNTNSIRKTC